MMTSSSMPSWYEPDQGRGGDLGQPWNHASQNLYPAQPECTRGTGQLTGRAVMVAGLDANPRAVSPKGEAHTQREDVLLIGEEEKV